MCIWDKTLWLCLCLFTLSALTHRRDFLSFSHWMESSSGPRACVRCTWVWQLNHTNNLTKVQMKHYRNNVTSIQSDLAVIILRARFHVFQIIEYQLDPLNITLKFDFELILDTRNLFIWNFIVDLAFGVGYLDEEMKLVMKMDDKRSSLAYKTPRRFYVPRLKWKKFGLSQAVNDTVS